MFPEFIFKIQWLHNSVDYIFIPLKKTKYLIKLLCDHWLFPLVRLIL